MAMSEATKKSAQKVTSRRVSRSAINEQLLTFSDEFADKNRKKKFSPGRLRMEIESNADDVDKLALQPLRVAASAVALRNECQG